MRLKLSDYRNIVVLTGAGISVASGLRPYRGPGGLWDEYKVAEYGHAESLKVRPHAVWKLFGHLRQQLPRTRPNAAHRALARAEQATSSAQSFTLVTQNVDGLHQLAGSRHVAELHGNISRTRCSNEACAQPAFVDTRCYDDEAPLCSHCLSALRPDIVLFGEPVDAAAQWHVKRALREVELFIAIGTSGLVAPACDYVRSAQFNQARTVHVNIEPPAHAQAFSDTVLGKAEEVLADLLGV